MAISISAARRNAPARSPALGQGELTFESHRIKTFQIDSNGRRIMPRAVPENWLDSPEVWAITQSRPALEPNRYPPLSWVSLTLAEWFSNRRWCWATQHRFCIEGTNDGAMVWVVLDAVSGELLHENVTRYSKGSPISTT